jgi:hypothetical protein
MRLQAASKIKTTLRKNKVEDSHFLISNLLQSYSDQNSGFSIMMDILTNGTELRVQK